MDLTIEGLLLQEIQETRNDVRALRSEIADWRAETATQLSEHDTKIKDISGNGQPGRMANTEASIKSLQAWRYWVLGVGATASSLAAFIGWYWPRGGK